MNNNKGNIQLSSELRFAVQTIKTAILQSQARAAKGVNQEQLALYYGVGRYISENTRNKKWGSGAIEAISMRLRQELPGLRGFGVSSLKNMRLFYEAWNVIEPNSPIAIGELECLTSEVSSTPNDIIDNQGNIIRLGEFERFPFSGIPEYQFYTPCPLTGECERY